jgi:hypothetical protein
MRVGGDPGTSSPFPKRPKGMHHETYQRLRSELCRAEMLAEAELGITLRRAWDREQRLEESRIARVRSLWPRT